MEHLEVKNTVIEVKNTLEGMNFPILAEEIDTQIQEAQKIPNKINPKRSTSRHIIIKMPKLKDKERIIKEERAKQLVIYKDAPIRMSADFSTETFQA